jgi:hypothetical protein
VTHVAERRVTAALDDVLNAWTTETGQRPPTGIASGWFARADAPPTSPDTLTAGAAA